MLPSVVLLGDGHDTFVGGGGNDEVFGGHGHDVLDGRSGADTLIGETGFDRVTYLSRTNAITVTLDGIADDGEAGEMDQIDTTCDMIIGGAGNDRISVRGKPHQYYIYGQGGNDTLIGGEGSDRLHGGGGDDDLRGYGGDDTLLGTAGRDIFNGFDGIDTVTYYYVESDVLAQLDARSISGTAREQDCIKIDVENIVGGEFNDMLIGNEQSNFLSGLNGNDTLNCGGGTDVLWGDGGDDLILAQDGESDDIDGGDGQDQAEIDELLDTVVNVP